MRKGTACADAKKRNRIKELENEIARLEDKMSVIQQELAEPEVCADYQLMQEKFGFLEDMKRLCSEYKEEWLALSKELGQ